MMAGTPLGPCPICGRPMIDGPSVDAHHWVPKSRDGNRSSPLHRVCHRMIHQLFDEARLARDLNTPDAIRAEPDIARFIQWVRKKPAEYVDWPRDPGRRRKGQR